MVRAWIKFVLWDQPAPVVRRLLGTRQANLLQAARFRMGVKLLEAPQVGQRISVRGWDCGIAQEVAWDERRQFHIVRVEDIFVDDGPLPQRETDFCLIYNAAITSGWEDYGAASSDRRAA